MMFMLSNDNYVDKSIYFNLINMLHIILAVENAVDHRVFFRPGYNNWSKRLILSQVIHSKRRCFS